MLAMNVTAIVDASSPEGDGLIRKNYRHGKPTPGIRALAMSGVLILNLEI